MVYLSIDFFIELAPEQFTCADQGTGKTVAKKGDFRDKTIK
jgi:hypothetical protein